MEDQDKLFEQFRASAEKAEQKGFDRMEALWNRVEDKLDREEQRKSATWWKYTGMAAVLVLFVTVGTFMYRENSPEMTPQGMQENHITVIDTQKVMETFEPSKENVAEEAVVFTEKKQHTRTPDNTTYDTLAPGRLVYRALPGQMEAMKDKKTAADGYYDNARAYITEEAADNGNTITFSGIVTDDRGMPLPGALVKSEGGTGTALSDINGRYTITAAEGDKVTASYIGMKSGSILAYKANNNRKVALAEENPVAANAKAKYTALRDLTPTETEDIHSGFLPGVNGTVAAIDEGKVRIREKQDEKIEANTGYFSNGLAAKKESAQRGDTDDYLQKQAAGISPSASNNASNRFPDDVIANSNPLYVIDGEIASEEAFRKIDAKDIVSITVLKDATATTVYGSRAKDGVIIIKTKKNLSEEELKKLERDMKRSYKETKKKLKAATKP